MNQLYAMKETLRLARSKWYMRDLVRIEAPTAKGGESDEELQRKVRETLVQDPLSLYHAKDLVDRIESSPDSFSSAKLDRWLGWIQCAAVAAGALTLDECENINRECPQDEPKSFREKVKSLLEFGEPRVLPDGKIPAAWSVYELRAIIQALRITEIFGSPPFRVVFAVDTVGGAKFCIRDKRSIVSFTTYSQDLAERLVNGLNSLGDLK